MSDKKQSTKQEPPPTVITLTLPSPSEGSIPLERATATLLIQRGDLAHVRQFTYIVLEDITTAIKEAYIALAAVEAEPPVISETPKAMPKVKPKAKAKGKVEPVVEEEPTIDVPLDCWQRRCWMTPCWHSLTPSHGLIHFGKQAMTTYMTKATAWVWRCVLRAVLFLTSTRAQWNASVRALVYDMKAARLHTPQIVLIDPDRVEQKNVGRQLYVEADVGQPKAYVLMRRFNIALGLCSVAKIS